MAHANDRHWWRLTAIAMAVLLLLGLPGMAAASATDTLLPERSQVTAAVEREVNPQPDTEADLEVDAADAADVEPATDNTSDPEQDAVTEATPSATVGEPAGPGLEDAAEARRAAGADETDTTGEATHVLAQPQEQQEQGEGSVADGGDPPGELTPTPIDGLSLNLAYQVPEFGGGWLPGDGTTGLAEQLRFTVKAAIPAGVVVPEATLRLPLPGRAGAELASDLGASYVPGTAVCPVELPQCQLEADEQQVQWHLGDIDGGEAGRLLTFELELAMDDTFELPTSPQLDSPQFDEDGNLVLRSQFRAELRWRAAEPASPEVEVSSMSVAETQPRRTAAVRFVPTGVIYSNIIQTAATVAEIIIEQPEPPAEAEPSEESVELEIDESVQALTPIPPVVGVPPVVGAPPTTASPTGAVLPATGGPRAAFGLAGGMAVLMGVELLRRARRTCA